MTTKNGPGPALDARNILMVMWLTWAVQFASVVVCYFVWQRDPSEALPPQFVNLLGVGPFFLSVIIRWLAMPRVKGPLRILVLFLVGCATAQLCGLLGILLGGVHQQIMFVLGLFAVGQFVPIFARRQLGLSNSGTKKRRRS